MNASNDPSRPVADELTPSGRDQARARGLAWAVTLCEAILWLAVAIALDDYWRMLPVYLRSLGALGLAGLAAVGIFRLVRFHRRARRPGK